METAGVQGGKGGSGGKGMLASGSPPPRGSNVTVSVTALREVRLRNVLYLHGFASSPHGRKVEALRAILRPRGFRIVAPDLNIPSFERLDFRAMSRICVWEMKKHLPAVVVGSSLGALVALEAGRTALAAPLVLVAPALGFGRRWVEKLPPGDALAFFHHGEERELLIHRRFFEDMARVDADERPPTTPVIVMMGERDESVPIEIVRGVWRRWQVSGGLREGSRFLEIPQGDHGLTAHVDRIAEEILAASQMRNPGRWPEMSGGAPNEGPATADQ